MSNLSAMRPVNAILFRLAFVLAALLCVFISDRGEAAPGTGEAGVDVHRISVSGESGLDGYVRYTRRVAPRILATVEERLGLRAEGEIEVIWVDDVDGLHRVLSQSRHPDRSRGFEPWVAGVALYPEQKVILRAASIRLAEVAEIDALIAHELAHIVLAAIRHPESVSQPVWLHEGLAQWVSERLVFDSPYQLKLAQKTGALHSFARLEGSFPEEAGGAAIAYQQSESLVRFLVYRMGAERVREVLRRMSEGENFYVAFRRVAGASFYDLETEWHEYIGRFELLPWVLSNSGAMFFGIAVIAAVGYWFKRRRMARLMDLWDQEDPVPDAEFAVDGDDAETAPRP